MRKCKVVGLHHRQQAVASINPVWGYLGAWVAVATLLGVAASGVSAVVERPAVGTLALLVTDLPSGYRPVSELASRSLFYAAGTPLFRIDDGDSHHGFDALPVWAKKTTGARTQGVVYGVEDGVIVSVGYLVRQADLVAGKSFHGLSLRELDFPPVHYLTVDLVEGSTADANLYLWLWHFRPQYGPARHMLSAGELPVVESLHPRFSVFACEEAPNYFCPRMGRHHTDLSKPGGRPPTATGDDGVIYGEAAGKLIFIEYTFAQKDLEAGVSWPAMPLDGLPIPPIDNVHLLHYEGADGAPGRYTAHMYLIPEETYLAWDREPPRL